MIVEVNDKKYKVKVAKTEEEQRKGLQGVTELPEDEGMLFIFNPPTEDCIPDNYSPPKRMDI